MDVDALATHLTELAARDTQLADAAAASAIRRARLTALAIPAIVRQVTSPADPVASGWHRVSSRPLDPSEPDGPTIDTRTSPDGATHVYLTGPAFNVTACARPPDPVRDFRFARANDGRIVPVYLVLDTTHVVLTQCGCGPPGCGHYSPPSTEILEYELPVQHESQVAAPIRVRVTRHTAVIRSANHHCAPVPAAPRQRPSSLEN